MKIINLNHPRGWRPRPPRARVIAEEPDPSPPPRPPLKRALLIGINYTSGEAEEKDIEALKGPHKDVDIIRKLLMDVYAYPSENIVVMTDSSQTSSGRVPNRKNILYEISQLVDDARPGDHFFFHYSGHAAQAENRNNSEEDGMDEYLIPVDGESLMIKDNELRTRLVDSLPVGSHLFAVFDSCHSASLLDLEHHRCNRVYVPWMSKGRRKSDSMWNSIVRRPAMFNVETRRIYQTTRTSETTIQSRRSSITQVSSSSPLSQLSHDSTQDPPPSLVHSDTTASSQTEAVSPPPSPPPFRRRFRTSTMTLRSSRPPSRSASPLSRENTSWFAGMDDDGEAPMRCESPTPIYACQGDCRTKSQLDIQNEHADVISLSSCKDSQLSWEDAQGASMSHILVELLRRDPHPTFKDLLTNVSHDLHKLTVNFHQQTKKYRKELKIWQRHQNAKRRSNSTEEISESEKKRKRKQKKQAKAASEGFVLEMDNFQNPQLSSHRPLNMDAEIRI